MLASMLRTSNAMSGVTSDFKYTSLIKYTGTKRDAESAAADNMLGIVI